MKKLDKFILSAFIGPFTAILLIVVFILMMQFLWLYIDELVGKGLGLAVILEFLMWGTCTILPLALPLATLLSSMMTLGQMTENNEMMAMKASGVSLVRIMIPLTIVSAIIAIIAFFVGNNLVPKAFNEIYTLRDDIGRTKEEIKIPSGTFYNGIEGYILRVDDQNKSNGMMYGVMVYDHTDKKGNNSMTLADSAMMRLSKQKDYLIFTLYDGINYQESNERKGGEMEHQLQKIAFREQQLIISLKNYAFKKSEDNRFGNAIKSQKNSSLIKERDSLALITAKGYEDHVASFKADGTLMMRAQLDTAWESSHHTEFEYDGFGVWKTRNDKIRALKAASEKAQRMSSQLTSFKHDNYSEHFYLRRARVGILR